jgi:ribosomal protein L13
VLQGKDKPTYAPHNDCGDVVVVVNADQVALTGNKLRDKLYFWHTGYPGGIKQRTAREMLEKDGTSVLREAVLRMLPRNLLRDDRARKLRLFVGPHHPGFAAEQLTPLELPARKVRNKDGLPDDFELPEGVVPLNPEKWATISAAKAKAKALRLSREAVMRDVLQAAQRQTQEGDPLTRDPKTT